jgi:hypothetical protein
MLNIRLLVLIYGYVDLRGLDRLQRKQCISSPMIGLLSSRFGHLIRFTINIQAEYYGASCLLKTFELAECYFCIILMYRINLLLCNLGDIHGNIGLLDQIIVILPIGLINRNADTCGYFDNMSIKHI